MLFARGRETQFLFLFKVVFITFQSLTHTKIESTRKNHRKGKDFSLLTSKISEIILFHIMKNIFITREFYADIMHKM
jgi:hypothetical protein